MTLEIVYEKVSGRFSNQKYIIYNLSYCTCTILFIASVTRNEANALLFNIISFY